MKTITRNSAINMFNVLGQIALGQLNEEALDAALANLTACGKVQEDMNKLFEELNKRMYAGVAEERKEAFFELVKKQEQTRASINGLMKVEEAKKAIAEIKELEEIMKNTYSDVYALYEKHSKAANKVATKEVEIDLVEVDANEFIKAAILGNKEIPVAELRMFLAPMFKEEKQETDMSELDELLAE